MTEKPVLPTATERLFNLEPWMQEWVDQLRADPKDKHFYQQPEAMVQMAIVTFRVFGERLVEPGLTIREAMEHLMMLWRAGHAQFVSDDGGKTTRIALPGDPAFKKTTRAQRRAQQAQSRTHRKAIINRSTRRIQ